MQINEPSIPFDAQILRATTGGANLAIERDELMDSEATAARAWNPGEWNCWNLSTTISETGSSILKIDGELIAEISDVDTRPDLGLGRLRIGINSAGDAQSVPVEVYVDDVELGSTPLPCP